MKRVHIIACRVFEPELTRLAVDATTELTIRYLDMGLHTGTQEQMRAALQEAVDAAPCAGDGEAVALAYGLCNRGIIGLRAGAAPLVIPRAYDCIGLLLGSSMRYLAELEEHPGTYFQTPGWVEHLPADRALRLQNVPVAPGLMMSREELIERYGADNAAYLLEQFAGLSRHYHRLAYIATPAAQGAAYRARAAKMAREQGWSFAEIGGDTGWLRRLAEGAWAEHEFLVVEPGWRIVARYDGGLMAAEPE